MVSNNTIDLEGDIGCVAFKMFSSSYVDILHNSFRVMADSGNILRIDDTELMSNDIRVLNNAFESSHYTINIADVSSITESNYNNHFTMGTFLFNNMGVDASLTDWSTTTTLDANSQSVYSMFNGFGNMHINNPALWQ